MITQKEILPEVIGFRRWMHENPELSEKEYNTAKEISRILSANGIEHQNNIGGTGIVAIIRGKGNGKTVAAKADMDALPIDEMNMLPYKSKVPGVMHACGHDANTAILLGTALTLKAEETDLKGTVKLFFEPAEETVGGGELMVKEGCMTNPVVDSIIGLHVMPYLNVGMVETKLGCLNAGTNEVEITIKGKGGHAAEPDACIDPIVVMSYVIASLQTLVSRNTAPTQSAVLTFGLLQSGTKGNIIPDTAFAKGTLRTLLPEQREFAKLRVKEIAEGTAKAFGAEAQVLIKDSYDPVINDEEIANIIIEESKKLLGEKSVIMKKEPSMGAEDFSYYTSKAKGAYFHIGCKSPDEETTCSLHTAGFHLDESCIEKGINLQVAILKRLLD